MMAAGHRAAAAPFAVGYAWTLTGLELTPWPVAIVGGALILVSSTWPDLDHPRFKGRVSVTAFFAWLVRVSAWIGYRIRTSEDQERGDFHRGPSHCLEWAILLGTLVMFGVSHAVPVAAGWSWAIGLAVTIGCVSHIAADSVTPSGVPISAIYNYVRHGEVWRRHSLKLIATDSALEHFAWTPLCYGLTGVMALSMVGLSGPFLGLLFGIGV